MSAVLESDQHAGAELASSGLRTIRLGLLGLGRVGQAVARLGPQAARLRDAGYRVRIAGALVRAIDKPRRCLAPSRITTNPSAFLRGDYDVVVEALGEVEPAHGIVRRLLGRGTPVVTANKALIATHGSGLAALAAERGTTLRYEASALAGVPFLGALAARPLVSDVQQFVGVVNGTSNFILTTLDTDHCEFAEALARAQSLGLTEPDPARDLDGADAADKLVLLASIFGWGGLQPSRLPVYGIRDLTAEDLAVARSLECTIKPVVSASRGPAGVSAFVGPALVPIRHPLAALQGTLSGLHLSGRFVPDLFFSGPGAGPDITAATILDDVVEAVSTTRRVARVRSVPPRASSLAAPPVTPWFVRTWFPGLVPDRSATTQIFASHNLTTTCVTEARNNTRWICLAAAASDLVEHALARLEATHRIRCFAIRSL
ncbi:MAG TPA: homoserine dehydrogenase [Vicinamibacterales bacterium]|nr:homoserine dehydrogenase [Vicinamibacterales bacterium]